MLIIWGMVKGGCLRKQLLQVLPVAAFFELVGEHFQLFFSNEAHEVSDFFRTSDLEALTLFDQLDKE